MHNTIRRALTFGAITAIGLTGSVAPANADETPFDCDPTVVSTVLDAAKADVRVARKAYTIHTKTSVHARVKQLKVREAREAKVADNKADRLTVKVAKATNPQARKEARAAAKAARAVARAEAKEAAKVKRASFAELRAVIKTDRNELKAQWNAAKEAFQQAKAQAEACEAPVDEPTTDGAPVDPTA